MHNNINALSLSWKLFVYNNTDWVPRKKEQTKIPHFCSACLSMQWVSGGKKSQINGLFGWDYAMVPSTQPSKLS